MASDSSLGKPDCFFWTSSPLHSQSDALSLWAKTVFSETRNYFFQEWTCRRQLLDACTHVNVPEKRVWLQKGQKRWLVPPRAFYPTFPAGRQWKKAAFCCSPKHAWFARCSLSIYSAVQSAEHHSKSVKQAAIFKHGTKPSQANSRSLHRMKEERQILQHCFANEPHTFVVEVRLPAVHSFSQLHLQLFAEAAHQCSR